MQNSSNFTKWLKENSTFIFGYIIIKLNCVKFLSGKKLFKNVTLNILNFIPAS